MGIKEVFVCVACVFESVCVSLCVSVCVGLPLNGLLCDYCTIDI